MEFSSSKEMRPIVTGFRDLDHVIGGLRIREITTVAGRPGMGTTAFCVSLLRNIGVVQKVPSAYFSLELNEIEIVRRLKASLVDYWEDDPYRHEGKRLPSKVVEDLEAAGFRHLQEGDRSWCDQDMNQAKTAIKLMKEAPVWIEHDLGVTMDEIVSRMEHLHQENHVRIFFVDGLKEIMYATKREELSQEIIKLRQAAIRLKVAVVITAPLNRSVEYRKIHRPRLSDLKDWGHIMVYSSMIIFIYRPEYYLIRTFEDDTTAVNMAEIMVEKSCYSRTGYIRMHFDNHASFRDENYDEDNGSLLADHPMPFSEPNRSFG